MKKYVEIPKHIEKFIFHTIDGEYDIWDYNKTGNTHIVYLDCFAPKDRHLEVVKIKEIPASYRPDIVSPTLKLVSKRRCKR
mgnify:CR=1 FL=1